MKKRKLLWQIFSSFIFITLLSLLGITWFASTSFRNFYFDQTQQSLEDNALLLRAQTAELLRVGRRDAMDGLCKSFKRQFSNRITVIDREGLVIGDSDYNILEMESHFDRPEFQEAMRGGTGVSNRYSATLQKKMLYLAMPVELEGVTEAVIRVSRPITAIDEALWGIQIRIALGWIVTGFLTSIIILNLARYISRPLERLNIDAQEMLNQNLKGPLPEPALEEAGGLAKIVNTLAFRLDQRNSSFDKERLEVKAILSSMKEAVLAVDSQSRVLRINQATGQLFRIDVKSSRGRRVQEVIRHQSFNRFVERALASKEPVLEELTVYAGPVYLLAQGTRLRDADGDAIGAVIVLNDVTELRRLENVRREFVANVSHELRTPITSIQGFVETLQEGAIDDHNAAHNFLGIIARQADRLKRIIEDLLSLSKIQQGMEGIEPNMERRRLLDSLQAVIQACEEKARENGVDLHLDCPRTLMVKIHANLFEQAIINLVDNAIKYGAPKPVRVRAYQLHGRVMIDVADQGPGIPVEHQSRIFERFYRVDKARSRALGGTGLGLSIVKNIAQAHGGSVHVTSEIGKGSVFTLVAPAEPLAEPETTPTHALA